MLDIYLCYLMSTQSKKYALERGRKPGGFMALTVCLWIAGELFGLFVGIFLGLGWIAVFPALLLGAGGAFIGILASKNCTPGNYSAFPPQYPSGQYDPNLRNPYQRQNPCPQSTYPQGYPQNTHQQNPYPPTAYQQNSYSQPSYGRSPYPQSPYGQNTIPPNIPQPQFHPPHGYQPYAPPQNSPQPDTNSQRAEPQQQSAPSFGFEEIPWSQDELND